MPYLCAGTIRRRQHSCLAVQGLGGTEKVHLPEVDMSLRYADLSLRPPNASRSYPAVVQAVTRIICGHVRKLTFSVYIGDGSHNRYGLEGDLSDRLGSRGRQSASGGEKRAIYESYCSDRL